MKYLGSGLMALLLTTAAVQAGGIDRSLLPYGLLFEKGNVAELGFSMVTPNVSGTYQPGLGGGSTGNMAESYVSLSFALKGQINDKLAYMVVANQPYGADANYKSGAYTGLEAHWNSEQLAGILKYQATERVSVYGGAKYVQSSANILIPPALLGGATYTASTDKDGQFGYIAGAAYEIPNIALRVALTYEFGFTHKFASAESFGGPDTNTTTTIDMPQSVALDFQTGVAADTLVFGSVRWSEWSKWHVSPPLYAGAPIDDEITGFDNDVVTWRLGVGRKINDSLSVFAQLGYEAPNHDPASRLSPTDGMKSIGIGGAWTKDKMKITGGVEYVILGDATDDVPTLTEFSDNHALGVGIKVDFAF